MPRSRPPRPKLPLPSPFAILFLVSMTTAAGNTALQSVLPSIGRRFGIADTLIAGVFSLSALVWTVSSPYWAHASDRHGRKPLIMAGVGGFVLSMTLFALAVGAGLAKLVGPGLTFAALICARAVYGTVGSAATPAAQAYVADRTAREDRLQALATLASGVSLGTVLGPALAPFFVLPVLSLAGPMTVFTLLGLLVLALIAWGLPSGDSPRDEQGRRLTQAAARGEGLWRDRRVAPFILYGFLLTSAQAMNVSILGFLVIDRIKGSPGSAQTFIGLAMFAGALATVVAQWGLIRMLRLNPRDLLRWGAVLAAAGNILIAGSSDYYTVVMGYALASLGYGFARPGFTAGASLAVGPEHQGAMAGLVGAVNGACYVASPLVGVALYEGFGPLPFYLCAAVLAGLTVSALRVPALAHAGMAHPGGAALEESGTAAPPPP